MTRGKHAAQAGRRRAEADNAEIARWRDEAAKWKRLANQYVERAQRVERLENALRKARGEVGVPDYEHDRELAELEARWAERWDDAMDATATIVSQLFKFVDPDARYLTSTFLQALQRLPEDVSRAATADAWTRDKYRTFMAPGAVTMLSHNTTEAIAAVALGRGYGTNPDGGIPREAVDDPEFQKALERVGDRANGPKKPREIRWV